MAQLSPEWSSQHRHAIKTLEAELGREICGVPTPSGLPCKNWPLSKEHGRCRIHAPGADDNLARQVEVNSGVETEDSEPSFFPRQFTTKFVIVLLVTGVLLGLFGAGAFLFYIKGPVFSDAEVSRKPIDPANPDFGRLIQMQANEEIDDIGALLEEISQNAENNDDRARALYMRYVLYQNVKQYQRSRAVARQFLELYPDHPRRAEVLFGLVYLNLEFSGNRQRAESFYNTLKEEFPDSKWTEQASEYF